MKLYGYMCTLAVLTTILVESDACHYVRRRRGRGKRQTEEFVVESSLWRLYFAECMASSIGDPRFDWNTNVDYAVLDSLWYLETDQISCSASLNEDTGECWRAFLGNFIDPVSPFLSIGRGCIDSYVNDTSRDPPIFQFTFRGKRQAPLPIPGSTDDTRTQYTDCIQSNVESADSSTNNAGPNSASRDSLNFDLLVNFIEEHTTFRSSICNPTTGEFQGFNQPEWPLRFEALTRPDSNLRASIMECNDVFFPPPNFWSNWSPFSECPGSCGIGVQVRSRTCRSGIDEGALLDEGECTGLPTERRQCGQPCPNVWSTWQQTSSCTQTCGSSFFTRQRFCSLASDRTQRLADFQCAGGQSTQSLPCNLPVCPPPDTWTLWSFWTTCTSTCGPGGTQTRSRTCQSGVNPAVQGQCIGEPFETRDCFIEQCIGEWLNWSPYSICRQNCRRTRNRVCTIPDTCRGPSTQAAQCNGDACVRSSGPRFNVLLFYSWSPWSEYERCLSIGGTRSRNRSCLFFGRSVGDSICVVLLGGESSESERCPVPG